jgi:predicted molibdopterin-dependent oxidoreductase YjgC
VRKAVEPPGEAKADWQIFCELSHRMGYDMPYSKPEDIFKEIALLIPQYAGISYERIEKVGLQWPVPDQQHPGTPVLHIGKFTKGRGLFIPEDYTPPKEMPDEDYPLILTTIRETPQYNFGSMTRKTPEIETLCPEALAEINPVDAARLGITDLDTIEVSSRRGSVQLRAKISDRSQVGTIAIPYHFAEVPVNNLTLNSLDRLSRSPQYKICAIKATKVEA